MKKLIASGLVVLLCGCAGLYSTIVTITQVRDTAMKELAQLNKAGKISAETDAKITQADLRYRQSAEVTLKALQAYKNGGDKAQYIAALDATKAAVYAIIDILVPMTSQSNAVELKTQLLKATTL